AGASHSSATSPEPPPAPKHTRPVGALGASVSAAAVVGASVVVDVSGGVVVVVVAGASVVGAVVVAGVSVLVVSGIVDVGASVVVDDLGVVEVPLEQPTKTRATAVAPIRTLNFRCLLMIVSQRFGGRADHRLLS
ncbi:MAG: hypothetical protein ACI9MX_003400, partial [Candidatus Aldehydirespiratoraceae bacterium]